jgi:two-component system, chemotaxis family, chemotaxis protein CheY
MPTNNGTVGSVFLKERERHILIVEDDSALRKLYSFLLTQYGYTISEAEDGLQALEQIAHYPCDLVITDMNMPFMDGLELLRVIRRDYPSIHVILISAFGSRELEQNALRIGADEYISKPFSFEDLEERIRRYFQNQNTAV